MSLNIDLPGELERRLEAEARRQGISTDALARMMLEQTLKLEDGNGSSDLSRVLSKNLPLKDRSREAEWLRENRDEYAGLWVALDGDSLIASGDDLKRVAETARQRGVPDALMMRVEPRGSLPFAGF